MSLGSPLVGPPSISRMNVAAAARNFSSWSSVWNRWELQPPWELSMLGEEGEPGSVEQQRIALHVSDTQANTLRAIELNESASAAEAVGAA